MFLFRFISFVLGYVNIKVKGENLEKFLNMAASRGIFLWDIKRTGNNEINVKTRLSAVKPLRHLGRNTKSRFKFRDREGLPFIFSRIRRRKSLVVGAVFFILGLYALSSFIWFVDIKGNNNLSAERIRKAAAEAGLKVGKLKAGVDESRVEIIIRERVPEIYYVGVDINGTRATIEIAEKTIIQKEEQHPASIVAEKSGLVKEVLVLVGNPVVKEGDTVVPGQTLISGVVPAPEVPGPGSSAPGAEVAPVPVYPPTYVHARGLVRARVWYEGYGEAPLVEEGTRDTGNVFSRVCIKIAGKEIILKGSSVIPFELYRVERAVKKPPGWRNLSLPVETISEKYIEFERFKTRRSRAEAFEAARKEALESVRADIKEDAQVAEEHTEEVALKNPDNIIRVRAFIETLEDIGVEKPLNP